LVISPGKPLPIAGVVLSEPILEGSTRTHVCWVLANTWANGSIYGTVEFAFKWSDIFAGTKVYWVETMTQYRPPAYRFLLTRHEHNDLVPYDPKTADGPLRQRDEEWYWNGNYCAEFMIEEDLPLTLCWRTNFLSHHPKICRLHGSSCGERNQLPRQSAASIVGYLIPEEFRQIRLISGLIGLEISHARAGQFYLILITARDW
jgi:hypothetical protein